MVLKPFISFFMEHTVHTNCDSPYCHCTNRIEQSREYPKLNFAVEHEPNSIAPEDIVQQVIHWIHRPNVQRCGMDVKAAGLPKQFFYTELKDTAKK